MNQLLWIWKYIKSVSSPNTDQLQYSNLQKNYNKIKNMAVIQCSLYIYIKNYEISRKPSKKC